MALAKNPASGAADRVGNCFVVTTIRSHNNASDLEIQDRRSAWLARRYRLAPSMAAAVAALHFGEVRA